MGNCIQQKKTPEVVEKTPTNSISLRFELDSKILRKTPKQPNFTNDENQFICTHPKCNVCININ